jgi:hypothetical protein
MKIGRSGRNQGCEGWTLVKRRPSLRAKRLGLRNGSSAFGHLSGKRRWRARTPKPVGLSGAYQTPSKLIKPNQSETMLPTRFDQAGWQHEPAIIAPLGTAERDQRKSEAIAQLRSIALNCT